MNPKDNKPVVCDILVEPMGAVSVRLTMKEGQNGIGHTLFANLKWVCTEAMGREETEFFSTSREKLAEAIKAFRIANRSQPRRGLTHKGQLKASPFRFQVIKQFGNHATKIGEEYGIGQHCDAVETWAGYKSRAEKLFDKPTVKVDRAERI